MTGAPVRVRLYATAREAVGTSNVLLPVPPGGLSTSRLIEALRSEYPRLAAVLPHCRIARNGRYLARAGERIRSGDEIAVHPPFSGG